MASIEETYRLLRDYLIENRVLGSANSLLGWDELTYMPVKAAAGRAKQMSLIARITHEQFVTPKVGDQLRQLTAAGDSLPPDAAANVREWNRVYQREVKVPSSLVEEMSRVAVLSRQAWGEAKTNSHYPTFAPWLEKTIGLRRELARCLCNGEPKSIEQLYDALLDEYEPYETTANLRKLFADLRPRLVALIEKVAGSMRAAPREILYRPYPIAMQKAFAESAAKAVGFDFEAGRLDTTLHPFCSGIGPGDTRITTRYDERDFGNCFFSVMHETGHALYDQGVPEEHWGTPLGDAVSLGIHESQSRLWENMVCRAEPFWRHFYPRAQETFRDSLGDVPLEQFLFAINDIRPSLIRTESDETTYNLHIILRFELEQALLWNDLSVADLPAAWNERMQNYLGVKTPDDRHGVLQDVHWSQGAFGYFPTYTLGNLNAAALFDAANRAIPELTDEFSRGHFSPLLSWLRENIHRHGQRFPSRQLMRNATGAELSIEPLLAHLTSKVDRYY